MARSAHHSARRKRIGSKVVKNAIRQKRPQHLTANLNPMQLESLEPRQLLTANSALNSVPIADFNNMPAGSPAITYADLNGDGQPDMLRSTGSGPNSLALSLSLGEGNFASPVYYPGGSNCPTILVDDVNGDGKADVLVVNNNEKSITVLRGLGNGTLQFSNTITFGDIAPTDASLVDWSHDGVLDLVIVGYTNGYAPDGIIATMKGNGDGTFGTLQTYKPSDATDFTSPQSVATGDFNGDHYADFVVTNQSVQAGYQIFMNNRDGAFTRGNIQISGDIPGYVTAADFNSQGSALRPSQGVTLPPIKSPAKPMMGFNAR